MEDEDKNVKLSIHGRAMKKGLPSKTGKAGGKSDLEGTCGVGDVWDICAVSSSRLIHTGYRGRLWRSVGHP